MTFTTYDSKRAAISRPIVKCVKRSSIHLASPRFNPISVDLTMSVKTRPKLTCCEPAHSFESLLIRFWWHINGHNSFTLNTREVLSGQPLRARLSELLLPRSIVLRNFSLLQLLPGLERLRPGWVLFAGQKIGEKIYVSARRNLNLRETALHLIQSHIFSHQVAIGDLDAIIDLLLSPTVESIAGP